MSLACDHSGPNTALPYGYAWLAQHALEANLFFEPAFLQPALEALAGPDVSLCVASDSDSGVPLAALPVTRPQGRYGPVPTPLPLMAWLHPYAMLGTPLVSPENPQHALSKLLDKAGQRRDGAPVLILPNLPQHGKIWPLLEQVLQQTGRRHSILRRFNRAGLQVEDPGQTSLRDLLGKRGAHSDKTSSKRLAALGAVEHVTASNRDTVTDALDAFFTLEASGWKGHAGTALRTMGHDHFAAQVVKGLSAAGRARIDLTLLDGKPIAGTVSLCDTSTTAPIWMPWKTAYDERYAKQAAGARSMTDLTQSLLKQADQNGVPLRLDSLATPDSVIANRLWRDPICLLDVAIDLQPGGSAAFTAIVMAERARHSTYRAARYARSLVHTATKAARR